MKNVTFNELYERQIKNQQTMIDNNLYEGFTKNSIDSLPVDDVKLFGYQMTQLVSEIGEVLQADKRWKNFRNSVYKPEDKLDELADCFIVMINACMFSGFSADDILGEINKKLNILEKRISKESH